VAKALRHRDTNGFIILWSTFAASQPAGRFYPDRFIVSVDSGEFQAECIGPTPFTYTGQDFGWLMPPSALIEPVSLSGNRTLNYASPTFTDPADLAFQKLSLAGISRTMPAADTAAVNSEGDPLAVTVSSSLGTLSPIAPGLLEYEYNASDTVSYIKVVEARVAPVATPALEFIIDSVVDSDNVTGAGAPYTANPVMDFGIRYGRLFLENTYGPETMDLRVPFEAQIWNGSRFERHTDENCWTYDTADAVITDTPPATSVDAETGTLTGGAPVSGAELLLEAPGEGNTGSVLVRYPVPSYWQDDFDGNGSVEDSTATATFGVYRGHDRVIYWQEVLD
jgi:MSHA biogenesis protein MshQ